MSSLFRKQAAGSIVIPDLPGLADRDFTFTLAKLSERETIRLYGPRGNGEATGDVPGYPPRWHCTIEPVTVTCDACGHPSQRLYFKGHGYGPGEAITGAVDSLRQLVEHATAKEPK